MEEEQQSQQTLRLDRMDSVLSATEFPPLERSRMNSSIVNKIDIFEEKSENLGHFDYHLPLRKKIKKMILRDKAIEVIQLLKEHYPELYKFNPSLMCSLLSIEVINFFKQE
mmetsp:Transcript_34230/g.33474  ORF Transcript_34230/g.33474 Transcript_34230/m.33474 type:complete len:111 (+) Transcript_34230:1017-1349(+)